MHTQQNNKRFNNQMLLKNTFQFLTCTIVKPVALLPAAFCLSVFLLLAACSSKKVTGITKDLTTGLTASYMGIKPESVFLMMNNERLGHTDIPIGESFVLINDGVSGLSEKKGKVSAGCSLRITDEQGVVLLDEKDLFASNDVFAKDEATRLKCTINTGKPMEWEKNYKIKVVFWDKYGDGTITNEWTIRSIDLP
ncbi:MAG: hypothetical protein GXC73_15485 [Chitinophagaceae bacterium]|nr:hypothetical protein [Chitinophagaceae bacterium]